MFFGSPPVPNGGFSLKNDGEVSCLREWDRETRSDEEEREIEEWS